MELAVINFLLFISFVLTNQRSDEKSISFLYNTIINLYLPMIKRYKQFEPLLISDFEVYQWQHPVHKHNHYELIYIKHGSGTHVINSVPVNYHKGDVFLIGPEEEHYFEVAERTRFIYLKFTDVYIHQSDLNYSKGLQHLEYLIKSRETHQSGFNLSPEDQTTVDLVFAVILSFRHDRLRN